MSTGRGLPAMVQLASALLFAVGLLARLCSVEGAARACTQYAYDGTTPPTRATSLRPRSPIVGFYQWENNNGYCGEVSLLQPGLAYGQWVSQFNTRSIASPFTGSGGKITQTGKTGSGIKFLSQILFDDFAPSTTTSANSFGKAAAYMRLNAKPYNSDAQPVGEEGYKDFMVWIKQQIRMGYQVAVGSIDPFDPSPYYSHIVNIAGIDTDSPDSDTFDGTDVLWIEDHGLITLTGSAYGSDGTFNPAVPPGTTDKMCTPFMFAYMFEDLKNPPTDTRAYQFSIPTSDIKNYGYAVMGVLDTQNVTRPVSLSMKTTNPPHPIVGYRYEAPMIGTSITCDSITNTKPAAVPMTLTATVSDLTIGTAYKLYMYKFTAYPLIGPLSSVPVSNFNTNAKKATSVTSFTATATTYTAAPLSVKSTDTVLYRCVPESAT